jgi:4'-phosphopantetheinyl transferase
VDLEWIDPRLEVREISKVALHRQELKELLSLAGGERRQRFFTLWTVKEAYLKGIGTGLKIPPHKILVDLKEDRVSVTALSGPSARGWEGGIFNPWTDFAGALAVGGPLGRIIGMRFEDLPGAEPSYSRQGRPAR